MILEFYCINCHLQGEFNNCQSAANANNKINIYAALTLIIALPRGIRTEDFIAHAPASGFLASLSTKSADLFVSLSTRTIVIPVHNYIANDNSLALILLPYPPEETYK